jgi:NAD(P)-dependent dehydrogenase (short-subunit alcohol dehydrogenase family)
MSSSSTHHLQAPDRAAAHHTGAPDHAAELVVLTGVGRKGQAGEAIARAFALRGAAVALIDVNADQVQARADELRADGFVATAHSGDLSDAESAVRIAAEVLSAHPSARGAVHALINAAGGFGMSGPLDTSDPAVWRRMFTISADTAYCATRAFLPALRKGKGSIVYFGSTASLPGGKAAGMAAYAGAKSAVLTLMRSVAQDERANGVRANAVAPVAIRTAQNVDAMGDKDSYVDRESVADVLLFLCSTAARNVSGQVIELA